MRTVQQIEEILPELDHCIADELEDQDLDFKQWDFQSRDKSVQNVVRMAVCMANGGGGTVVFGVADKVEGRENALLGIPLEIDINLLKKAVYDQTDPKIMPVFEELRILEGTGRLLVMQIHSGLPPYTDTSGRGTVRVGKDCQPLTGTVSRKIAIETAVINYDVPDEDSRGNDLRDRRIKWEAAKTRVLNILIDRANSGKPGLSNQEIRRLTGYDRNHVFRLMAELRTENASIQPPGKGAHARYVINAAE